jgi:hypothetical protein
LPDLIGVRNKTHWIDENLALVETRMKYIAKYFARDGCPPFLCQNIDADRTAEISININSERPGIGRFVVTIKEATIL